MPDSALSLGTPIDRIVANDRRVAPARCFQRLRDDVFRGRVHHVAERVAGLHGSSSLPGRLHDAVQGDEFTYDELAHDPIPRVRVSGMLHQCDEWEGGESTSEWPASDLIRVLKDRLG